VIVRRMVADLCLPVEVVGGATVREPSGLALSSRNAYLDAGEREVATALSRALRAGAERADEGADAVLAAATVVLEGADLELDYLTLRSAALDDPPAAGEARLLVAARVGRTRLIDNVAVHLGVSGPGR
jgi:pantoate--beta-alanine ligase